MVSFVHSLNGNTLYPRGLWWSIYTLCFVCMLIRISGRKGWWIHHQTISDLLAWPRLCTEDKSSLSQTCTNHNNQHHSNIHTHTQRTNCYICTKTTHHSETQSSQNMCLQRRRIGVCIFSWQMAHRSPAAFTCSHFSCLFRIESERGISYIYI